MFDCRKNSYISDMIETELKVRLEIVEHSPSYVYFHLCKLTELRNYDYVNASYYRPIIIQVY